MNDLSSSSWSMHSITNWFGAAAAAAATAATFDDAAVVVAFVVFWSLKVLLERRWPNAIKFFKL
jgi:hypothetical protein